MSSTAHRISLRHSVGWLRNQEAALSAVLPGTMSNNWRLPTSTTDVHHCLVLHLPSLQNRVSSTPTASTRPNREVSASNSASPHRVTSLFTVCQSHPNSSATSETVRPRRPTWSVAHRPARDVNKPRSGATPASCSANDPTPHTGSGHIQRRFRHRSRTGRPNAGKSTTRTSRSPLDHTLPPHPSHTGRGPRDRIVTLNLPLRSSSTPTRSTSPRPTSTSHIRLPSVSTGSSFSDVKCSTPDYGGPSLTINGYPTPPRIPKNQQTLLDVDVRASVCRVACLGQTMP